MNILKQTIEYKDIPQSIQLLLEDYCLNRGNDTLIGSDPQRLCNNIQTMLVHHSPFFVAETLRISESFVIMINELIH